MEQIATVHCVFVKKLMTMMARVKMLMMVLLLSFLIYKDVPLMMEIKQGAKKSMLCKG